MKFPPKNGLRHGVGIDGEGLEFEGEFVPVYNLTFPNGLGCGECRRGTIRVVVD